MFVSLIYYIHVKFMRLRRRVALKVMWEHRALERLRGNAFFKRTNQVD